jgi:glutathionyl-hydroquinone reductase
MGRMVDGQWTTEWYRADRAGQFHRPPTQFRGTVTADGSSRFPAAPGRYHLYVSLACPWASRTLIVRALRRLEDAVPVTVVDPVMGEDGWRFGDDPDPIGGAGFLREVYARARPDYTGRVTVPVLWDRATATIVSNESRDIIRMLDRAFDRYAGAPNRLFPDDRLGEVEAMIDANYAPVNDGVYRAGFATTQAAYEDAATRVFARLDQLEALLATRRFLCGPRLTAADVCLFTTLYRFDPVYYLHFKCNLRRLVDYPNLWGFVRDVYQTGTVAATCDLDHVKAHYYRSHPSINPRGIVPVGPELDYTSPHGRDRT